MSSASCSVSKAVARALAKMLGGVAIALAVGHWPAIAADTFWINPGTGSWFDGANWSDDIPASDFGFGAHVDNGGHSVIAAPGARAGFIRIGDTQTGTVQMLAGSTLSTSKRSFIGAQEGSTGTVEISGLDSKWTNNLADVMVGYEGTGQLKIYSGGVYGGGTSNTTQADMIGALAGSIGSVLVSGEGSSWSRSSPLFVGNHGTGTLMIENKGKAKSQGLAVGQWADSQGAMTVTGDGSSYEGGVIVGEYGRGLLTVADGASVGIGVGAIGARENSYGKATVTGLGSIWNMSGELFFVGRAGNGELLVSDGGSIINLGGTVGEDENAVGSVTVTGEGSKWQQTLAIFLGGDDPFVDGGGEGSLTVSARGSVSSLGGSFGRGFESKGSAFITGAGSVWNSQQIVDVGLTGRGELTIADGGKLVTGLGVGIDDGSAIGRRESASGVATVTGAGSKWTNSSTLTVGDQGVGELTIADGAIVTSGAVSGSLDHSNIANLREATGKAVVNGAGSAWNIDTPIDVAVAGLGELKIAAGGAVTNQEGTIAVKASAIGHVTVTGPNSTWINDGNLIVGAEGTAELTIANGGTVTNLDSFIGQLGDSSGKVMVTGPDSNWNNDGLLFVGFFGSAELVVSNGGTVSASAIISLFDNTILVEAGGTLVAADVFTSGTLTNQGAIHGNLSVGGGGHATGSGIFDGSVVVSDGGIFSPGSSPGAANTPETFWTTGGVYQWEINALAESGGGEGGDPGWDLWNTGALTIDGPFTIAITTLASNDDTGPLEDWNPAASHQWRIATNAEDSFLSLKRLLVDTSAFQNPLAGGSFWLSSSADGKDLYLNFSPVPEPSALLLAIAGVCGVTSFSRRFRR